MSPVSVWFISVGLWALCHFWLLPVSKDRWKTLDMRGKLARAGALVVFEKVRDLAAVAALMISVVMALVLLSGLLASTSSVFPQAVILAASSVHAGLKRVGEQYGMVLGAVAFLGAIGALYLAAKSARQRVSQVWSAKAQEAYASLQQDPEMREAARKDPELEPVVQKFDEVIGRLVAADRGDEIAQLSEPVKSQLQHEASELLSILAIEIARKNMQFEEAVATPTQDEAAQPKSRWQRLLHVISSDRFAKDLGLVKKPLSHVTTALIVLSLIGWSAEPLADSLHLALNSLRINAVNQQAQRELDDAITKAPPPKPTAAADPQTPPPTTIHTAQSAARLVARVAVEQMTHSGVLAHVVQVDRVDSSQAEYVRAALNDEHLLASPDSDSATKVRREAADSLAKKLDDTPGINAAKEQIERDVKPALDRMKQKNPSHFSQWANQLEARYATPMAPLDAQGKLIAQILDDAFSAADVQPATELGKQSQKLVKDFGKEAVKTWSQSWAKTWVTDSIIDAARPAVRAATAQQFEFEASANSRRFVADLIASEGHGWTRGVDAERDTRIARAVADKVAALHEPEMRAALMEQMGGYEQLFPKDAPSAGGGGPSGEHANGRGSAGAKTHAPPTRTFAQSRATNFHLASRSFRVRGVLIGQDTKTTGLDVSQIRWSIKPAEGASATSVNLAVQQSGKWIELGTYDAGVVNQALRYASDRRVIATTITGGDGQVVGRLTYLHPVLADTPLGCRVVEADRLIDTFSFPREGERIPTLLKMTLGIDRVQMDRWRSVVELTAAVSSLPEQAACPKAEIDRLVIQRKLGNVRFSPALSNQLNAFISAEEKKLPGSTKVLRTAQACQQSPMAGMADCLCDKAKGSDLPPAYWYPEDHTSQFRERSAPKGSDFAWMQHSSNRLDNVDLWVHTTFSLRKPNTKDDTRDESTASAMDFPAEALQALRMQVAETLPGYLKMNLNSPSYDDFMLPLEDFILLQRFFRTALAGGLGKDFPLGQLLKLAKETRPFVAKQPTIRWEPAKSQESLEETLQAADPAARASYVAWRDDSNRRRTTKRPTCDRVSN
ncbi:hypothetical protein [Sphaerotilus sp.]|uniref:hypothetical protein n=1 Tax=Sphaerotilus sp. TaxID=2093942 RepID=UPI00286E8FA5|nr:hypothetical protein [Sphaerotilus sp.]